jgi:hypothetical protein
VIPTMIFFGAVTGRAWAVPVGAVLWAALLLSGGIIGLADAPAAAALGAANTAVGAVAHWSVQRCASFVARSKLFRATRIP